MATFGDFGFEPSPGGAGSRLRDLKVSVAKATPTEDHSTFKYHIQLQYGGVSWEVQKRFSEFDILLQGLANQKYAGLPRLPSKTFLGAPSDSSSIGARKEQLRILLNDLLIRPDTRSSQVLRQFLAMDSHMDAPTRSLQPDAIRTFEDPRFGVSGLSPAPQANLILVTHEDATHLSRLGRVWSVVEPDELGALHLWAHGNDGAWKRVFSKTFAMKARCLCWEGHTRQFFVGLEDGRIEVYEFEEARGSQPILRAELALHHKSPVTYLGATSRRLLSLGFDTAMRVIDVRTRELTCGGRLMKRMKGESDYLTTGHLEDGSDRAFIGTSGGDLFILDISANPPNFLHTVDTSPGPIAGLCPMGETFLVAHGDCVTVLSPEGRGAERRIAKLGCHRAKHLLSGEVTIQSIASSPSKGLIFAGFSDGSVAVWSKKDGEALIVWKAHDCDVTAISWLEEAPWGPALLTGGGDGKVTTWNMATSPDEFTFWTPQPVDGSNANTFEAVEGDLGFGLDVPAAGTDGLLASSAEPAWGSSADLFRIDNPRVNPQALKGRDESDSDDDLLGAFK